MSNLRSTCCAFLSLAIAASVWSESCAEVRIASLVASQLDEEKQGVVLLEELNCVACHDSAADLAAASKTAPRLANVAKRVNPYYLKQFIQSPHAQKPGTTMPNVMGHLEDAQRQQAAESITQFLLSLNKDKPFDVQAIDSVAAESGQELFHSVGCVACHSPRNETGDETMIESSTPLGELHLKYNFDGLTEFLRRPHAIRPSGRMPDLRLSQREIEKIASYLLQKTQVPGRLKYTILRGRVWEGLDVNVDAQSAGLVDGFDLSLFKKIDKNSAIIFEGFLDVATAGEYQFDIEMNGGELLVNGKEVVNLASSNRRNVKQVSGKVELEQGWNAIKFTYIHTGKEPSLSFAMKGPELPSGPVPASMLSISKTPIAAFEPFPTDPDLVAKGREHFVNLGCADCHDDVKVDSDDREPRPALGKLNTNRGCLSDGSGSWPRYALSAKQSKALKTALTDIEATEKLSDEDRINVSLVQFNCIACHQRDGAGGMAPERNVLFAGDRNELGNDGRIPPGLNHVGAKLTPQWMDEVLFRGGRQRPYMATRMPQFGKENIGHLPKSFATVDTLEDVTFEPIADEQAVKAAGHDLVGVEGFSCIACHDFNGQRAAGPGAMDIILSTERLQKDWFYLFMLDPNRFRPGTIMPAAWPGGHVFKKDMLDGDAKKQIESIWVYLQDGKRAKNPKGLSRQAPEVRVTDVAEICRGRGNAGYRGIAVGYPERVNLAFDSEEMNLRLLWKNDFVTVDHGRFQARGDQRIEFPQGIPFHRLKSMEDNWPYKRKTDYEFPQDHGYQFKGYFLDAKRRPTFMYRYGDVGIEEFFEDKVRAKEDGKPLAYFERRFKFESPEEQDGIYFRAAVAKELKANGDAGKSFGNDRLTVSIASDHVGQVREGEEDELLIPLKLPAGKSTLVLEYTW